ncbi:MAG: hypothetical protein PHW73_01910 [Atribacterota bacterium]|nr:hypothetical protein [Atribacterota bacterium]
MIDIINSSFAPAFAVFIVIAIVAWFKMIPGAQNENLKALWPGVAIMAGIGTQIYYALITGQSINLAIGVGVVIGLTAAGLYKVADKASGK